MVTARGRGSSPHTRGARHAADERDSIHRIIPAYAGSTPTRRRPSGCRRDHPRIRGEHNPHLDTAKGSGGSSPHTRGAPPHTPSLKTWTGIIPAYAGSTRYACAAFGEVLGSSPHTRGAPHDGTGMLVALRIIPAYAGSTTPLRSRSRRPPDHPRIRGEHGGGVHWYRRPVGSSPHTRGARPRASVLSVELRIIPAYAGSTLWRCRGAGFAWDHPRIRGEHPRST